uniref:Si:dkeyp-97e7.9 n=1 Tax=Cyprinus carpio TaxID=7962 RepID=A0A8C1IMT3_CYPCA
MFKVLVTRIKRRIQEYLLRLDDSKLIKDRRHHLRKHPNCSVAQGRTYPLGEGRRLLFQTCFSEFMHQKCIGCFLQSDYKQRLLQLRQEKGVAYEPSFPGYMLIDWLLQNGEIEKHGIIQHVSLKHHFFDSGLLYQFCINFRRWRCLSELLHETENEEVECITHQSQEDQADSPFTLYKTPPCEGNSYFLSDSKIITNTTTIFQCYDMELLKRHVTCEELLSPGAPYVKRVLMVSLGFVVRGKSPCYVQAVDPGSPAVAAGIKVIITRKYKHSCLHNENLESNISWSPNLLRYASLCAE